MKLIALAGFFNGKPEDEMHPDGEAGCLALRPPVPCFY